MRLLLVLLWILPALAAATPVRTDHAEAELVAERTALVPGETVWLGLRIAHDPGWHTYWINPGDSGLGTRLAWTLPEGFVAGEPRWPRPVRIAMGPLTNFGYEGELLLPVPLMVPEGVEPGTTARLGLRADWLICEEICIPDGADLELALPIGADSAIDTRWATPFATARARLPQPYPGRAALAENENGFRLEFRDPPVELLSAGGRAELYPVAPQLLANARDGAVRLIDNPSRLSIQSERSPFFAGLPERIELLVAAGPGADDPAWHAVVEPISAAGAANSANADPVAVQSISMGSLLRALLLAFAGGVLLNLMPCVFPVLSLKALGLAESGGDRARLRRHGWIYTAGVLLSFAALSGALLAVRAGGEAAGWGFQLQQPWFVAALAYLIFVLGLSLSGAVNLGASLMGVGQRQVGAGGDRGAFMTGVLACIVASPCTAPFMGAALGYAITLPAAAAMTVFLALGFGLAFPLLLISLVPVLSRWLPRPGRWMETFKQAMAFPLYLTALWLLWVLGRQTDFETAMTALLGMLLIAFALWLWPAAGQALPRFRRVSALICAGLSLVLVTPLAGFLLSGGTPSPWHASLAYAPETLAEVRAAGRPVLVNMTADWCITCKVNERVALSGHDFHDTLLRYKAAYMIGDWTNSDRAITNYLAGFGRNGVPLYVLYPADGGEPEVLPAILTPQIVRDALRRAAAE